MYTKKIQSCFFVFPIKYKKPFFGGTYGTQTTAGRNSHTCLRKYPDKMHGIFLPNLHVQLYRRRRHGAVSIDFALIYTGIEHHCQWIHRNRFSPDCPGTCPRRKWFHRQNCQTIRFLVSAFEHPSQLCSLLGCRLDCPACLTRA